MKNDIYLKLNPIERQLRSAKDSNYARLSSREFEDFCATYAEHFGKELTRNERNCNTCRLKAIKHLAEDYFQYQEWYKGRWGRKPEDPKPENETEKTNADKTEKTNEQQIENE